ncbi:MAG: hypothetical protein GY870_08240 [archaeon]|nr:hypothetical protein [archaeon]
MNGVIRYLNCMSLVSAMTDMFLYDKEKKEPSLIYRSEKLKESITKSIYIQKGDISKKNVDKMYHMHKKFEDESGIVEDPDATVMISFMLLLTERVKNHMKDSEKLKVLGLVIKRLNWLMSHKYIDPKLDKHDCYVQADMFLDQWDIIFK